MKIGQMDNDFGTIVLQLQTREEAELLWALLRGDQEYDGEAMNRMRTELSNWFSNHAKL